MSDLVCARPTAATSQEIANESVAFRSQGTPKSSSDAKGPRGVMNERNAREGRRRAQIDQLERNRAVEEAELMEERRKSSDRRVSGAADKYNAEASEKQYRVFSSASSHRRADNILPAHERTHSKKYVDRPQGEPIYRENKERPASGLDESGAERLRSKPLVPDPSRPIRSDVASAAPPATSRSSFPHAFERWETLSAHWEGLTSFWIRRLEENSHDIDRDPLSQQLSRQVTDLSAAGANLFHAVVELQRLRASSERKFQRWFYETRSEQERNQEIQAAIESKLQAETSARVAAVATAAAFEREKTSSDKRLAEMKRELQISREEARRAWEELGRREQEERARTASLREGLPTVMGGVQVVPMMAGVMSRPGTTLEVKHPVEASPTTYGPQATNNGVAHYEPSVSPSPELPNSRAENTAAHRTPVSGAAGDAEPVAIPHPTSPHSQPPASFEASYPSANAFCQQSNVIQLEQNDPKLPGTVDTNTQVSFCDQNEEELLHNDQGQFTAGHQVSHSDFKAVEDCLSEMDVAMRHKDNNLGYLPFAPMPGVEYGRGPTVPAGYPHIPGSESVTNSEIGDADDLSSLSRYQLGTQWGGVPRHNHPTRLSDVMEEDERSRTSASQVSRS